MFIDAKWRDREGHTTRQLIPIKIIDTITELDGGGVEIVFEDGAACEYAEPSYDELLALLPAAGEDDQKARLCDAWKRAQDAIGNRGCIAVKLEWHWPDMFIAYHPVVNDSGVAANDPIKALDKFAEQELAANACESQ